MKFIHEHYMWTSLTTRFRQRLGTFGLIVTVCLAPMVHQEMMAASHCPHEAGSASNHCLWQCDGVDAQASTGKNHGVSVDPDGFLANVFSRFPRTSSVRAGIVPRGPPVASFA